ncbi:MAG TPA: PIN domain-containing protein [Thermoanaerobaculia bacterium]|nr:PIN domain-containing protein [Thermoanaerobaculia bacterium]
MIALDTNVLVRLLIEDDKDQLAKALRVLEPLWESGGKALLTDVVLAELEWVLVSTYNANRAQILTSFHALAADNRFEVQDRPRLLEALRRYQVGRAELSDYLVGLAGSSAGAGRTLTFDRALRGDPVFQVL